MSVSAITWSSPLYSDYVSQQVLPDDLIQHMEFLLASERSFPPFTDKLFVINNQSSCYIAGNLVVQACIIGDISTHYLYYKKEWKFPRKTLNLWILRPSDLPFGTLFAYMLS